MPDVIDEVNETVRHIPEATRVTVTDVNISFGNLVGLLVKVVFAAIPAAIIVAIVIAFALGIVRGIR